LTEVLKIVLLLVFLVSINITDYKEYKIKNKNIVPLLLAGLILSIFSGSFIDSIYGMLIPLVLFPFYALRMLGAGDVKALCAIGAVVGFRASLYTMAFSFISGGIIAIIFTVVNRNFRERMKYLFSYLKLCFFSRKVQQYGFGGGTKSYFRFSYAISAGTVLMLINEYLHIL